MPSHKDIVIEGQGSWKEKWRSRFKEPDSLNSELGSQELSTTRSSEMRPQALPGSANELVDALLEDRRQAMRDLRVEKDEKRKNSAIRDHYHAEAEKVMESLRRECQRLTGHSFQQTGMHERERNDEGNGYKEWRTRCVACGLHAGSYAKRDNASAIRKLGDEMRKADRNAGVEWIPKKY